MDGKAMRLMEEPGFWVAGFMASIGAMLVSVPLVIAVLMGMMLIDVIVGILVAGMYGEINSKKAYRGGIRKVIVLLVVLATWFVQLELTLLAETHLSSVMPDLPSNIPLAEFVAGYFVTYFFWSILENSVRAGLPLPDQLTKFLKVKHDIIVSE